MRNPYREILHYIGGLHIASTTFLRLMHVMKSVQTRNEIGTCMYRAKRKAPAILTEPFNKTNGAFCQEKSLCLISEISLSDFTTYSIFPFLLQVQQLMATPTSMDYYTCRKV